MVLAWSWQRSFWWFAPCRGARAAFFGFRGSGQPPECPGTNGPAGAQGLIRSRSPQRTRAAPARAWSAPRLVARILRRVDIAFALEPTTKVMARDHGPRSWPYGESRKRVNPPLTPI